MAESGSTPELKTGNPLVDAALRRMHERNNERFKDLEDAMVVQAHLEKPQTEFLVKHAEAIRAHDEWMLHFQAKVDVLTDMMMRP